MNERPSGIEAHVTGVGRQVGVTFRRRAGRSGFAHPSFTDKIGVALWMEEDWFESVTEGGRAVARAQERWEGGRVGSRESLTKRAPGVEGREGGSKSVTEAYIRAK